MASRGARLPANHRVLVCLLSSPPLVVLAASPPHIVSILVDDLGFYDSQVHNSDSFMTGEFGELAKQGIVLERHHAYMYCSPTRRSFLSGRFPNHITGDQAPICSNYLPLNLTLLPAKLKEAEYETHMIG